jgi:hypothetical protein
MFASALRYAAWRASVRAACFLRQKLAEKSSLSVLSYLLLVVQALVVVLKHGHAFGLAAVVLGVCVGDVACKDLLPEGEAARGAWPGVSVMYSDL